MHIKRILFISLVAALALVVGVYFYFFNSPSGTQTRNDANEGQRTINYEPPTNSEQQSGNEQKREITEGGEEIESQKNEVQVGIVDAGQYEGVVEVRSFVEGINEGGGTCTATFTYNSHTVKETVFGYMDATTTQCKPMSIDRSRFPTPGEWNLVVFYESESYTGSSENVSVSID